MSGPKSDSIGLGGIAIGAAAVVAGAAVGAVYLTGAAVKEVVGRSADMLRGIGEGFSEIQVRQMEQYKKMVEKYRRALMKIESMERGLQKRIREMRAVSASFGSEEEAQSGAFFSSARFLEKMLEKLKDTDMSTDPEAIGAEAERMLREAELISEKFDKECKKQLSTWEAMKERSRRHEDEAAILGQYEHKVGASLYVQFSLAREELNGNTELTEETKARLCAMMIEAEELQSTFGVSTDDLIRLSSFAQSLQKASAYTEADALRCIESYELVRTSVLEHVEEYEKVYREYLEKYIAFMQAVNNEIGEGEREHVIIPKPRSSFAGVREILDECEKLEKATKRRVYENYIAMVISHVMREHGYAMEKDVILHEEDTSKDTVFLEEGTGRAVHVSVGMSESGKPEIMMETVRVEEGEKPDGSRVTARTVVSRGLSEQEREEGYRDQVRFCEMHAQIVEELKQYGIFFTEDRHLDPDPKFSKKMIVYSSESVTTEELREESKLIHYGERRRKQTKAKARAIDPNRK